MKPFYLSEITTKDGLVHQGIFHAPRKSGKRAVLWVHGLSAAFYNDIRLYETVTGALDKRSCGFALFNNRGHDLLAGIRKYDGTPPNGYSYFPGGAGYEVFEQSVLDIEAGIKFLVDKGFSEIIVVGHSTGANKTCYFAATQNNSHVIGAVLSGPMSDRLDPDVDSEKRKKDIAFMRRRILEGKGDELLLGYHFFPMTPKRYMSLFEPGSLEDTFDYGDKNPKMTFFSKIQLPLLVLLAGADEYQDRPIEAIRKVFDAHARSKHYKSVIIPGALHKFHRKEQEVTEAIGSWITAL